MIVFLLLGVVLAAIITRWINWLTWGENQDRKMKVQEERRERARKLRNENENRDDT